MYNMLKYINIIKIINSLYKQNQVGLRSLSEVQTRFDEKLHESSKNSDSVTVYKYNP